MFYRSSIALLLAAYKPPVYRWRFTQRYPNEWCPREEPLALEQRTLRRPGSTLPLWSGEAFVKSPLIARAR